MGDIETVCLTARYVVRVSTVTIASITSTTVFPLHLSRHGGGSEGQGGGALDVAQHYWVGLSHVGIQTTATSYTTVSVHCSLYLMSSNTRCASNNDRQVQGPSGIGQQQFG